MVTLVVCSGYACGVEAAQWLFIQRTGYGRGYGLKDKQRIAGHNAIDVM